jgi:uncharacterized protein YebE (UPF0316 family)
MDFTSWIHPEWLPFIMPVIIFCARVTDVTIGTLRIVFITRGNRLFATVLGFCEVFVWLLIVSQVITNMDNIFNFFAYAGGYAFGNYVGIFVENKLAIGNLIVRIITQKPAKELINYFDLMNYRYTNIPAEGNNGAVNVLFTIIKRKDLEKVIDQVMTFNPQAVYTVEDVRAIGDGALQKPDAEMSYLRWLRPLMKGK